MEKSGNFWCHSAMGERAVSPRFIPRTVLLNSTNQATTDSNLPLQSSIGPESSGSHTLNSVSSSEADTSIVTMTESESIHSEENDVDLPDDIPAVVHNNPEAVQLQIAEFHETDEFREAKENLGPEWNSLSLFPRNENYMDTLENSFTPSFQELHMFMRLSATTVKKDSIYIDANVAADHLQELRETAVDEDNVCPDIISEQFLDSIQYPQPEPPPSNDCIFLAIGETFFDKFVGPFHGPPDSFCQENGRPINNIIPGLESSYCEEIEPCVDEPPDNVPIHQENSPITIDKLRSILDNLPAVDVHQNVLSEQLEEFAADRETDETITNSQTVPDTELQEVKDDDDSNSVITIDLSDDDSPAASPNEVTFIKEKKSASYKQNHVEDQKIERSRPPKRRYCEDNRSLDQILAEILKTPVKPASNRHHVNKNVGADVSLLRDEINDLEMDSCSDETAPSDLKNPYTKTPVKDKQITNEACETIKPKKRRTIKLVNQKAANKEMDLPSSVNTESPDVNLKDSRKQSANQVSYGRESFAKDLPSSEINTQSNLNQSDASFENGDDEQPFNDLPYYNRSPRMQSRDLRRRREQAGQAVQYPLHYTRHEAGAANYAIEGSNNYDNVSEMQFSRQNYSYPSPQQQFNTSSYVPSVPRPAFPPPNCTPRANMHSSVMSNVQPNTSHYFVPANTAPRANNYFQDRNNNLLPTPWKDAIGVKIIYPSEALRLILSWKTEWLRQPQTPPIITQYYPISYIYRDFEHYFNTYFPCLFSEIWCRIQLSFQHLKGRFLQYEITQVSSEDKIIVVSCECEISGSLLCPNQEDLLILEFQYELQEIKIFGYVKSHFYKCGRNTSRTCFPQKTQISCLQISTMYRFDIHGIKAIKISIICSLKPFLCQIKALSEVRSTMLEAVLHPQMMNCIKVPIDYVGSNGDSLNLDHAVQNIISAANVHEKLPYITVVHSPAYTDIATVLCSTVVHLKGVFGSKPAHILICTRGTPNLKNIGLKLSQESMKLTIVASKEQLQHNDLENKTLEKIARGYANDEHNDVLQTELQMSDVVLSFVSHCIDFDVQTALGAKSSTPFRVCLIDDAFHCTETETLVPIIYGIKKFIFFGDANVEPYVKSPISNKAGFKMSMMERIIKAMSLR